MFILLLDGNPVLGFGLYEVVKALELVTCVLGWAWLNNILVRGYLWDILACWVTRTQSGTHCTDTTTPCLDDGSLVSASGSKNSGEPQGTITPCLDDGSCEDGRKTIHCSLDSSLSTSRSKNKEETQRTTTPCSYDDSCNDGSKTDHHSLGSSLSTSSSKNNEEKQGTDHAAETSSITGVLRNNPQDGTNQFFEPTVVAAIRLLG